MMSEEDLSQSTDGVALVEAEVRQTLDQWRREDCVYWDREREAWVVTGYAEVARILEDSKNFWRDIPLRDGATEFWGRHLLNLEGRDHHRLHALHMKLTGEDFAEATRESAARIAINVSAQLVDKGQCELASEYADAVPFLIGCEFLGLDIRDRAMTDQLLAEMRTRATWKEALHAGFGIPLSSQIAQDGRVALERMASVLLPTIRARRDSPEDDLISAFWREGTRVFPDWDENDMVSSCWSNLDNETKPLLRGLLYILCRDQGLQSQLRQASDLVPGFVEEGLRYLTPFRTIRRVAKADVMLGDKQVRVGDSLYLITPLANQDESKWACPHSFKPERNEEVTHFAFGLGAGYCVGRYLGRMEAAEAVRGILAASSRFELDPAATERPRWSGEMYHSVFPLYAIIK